MQGLTIVGVLNLTPDSFYDGGKAMSSDAAVKRAGEMFQAGADVVEIGGESTGPGSPDVSAEDELKRTIDSIKAIKEAYPHGVLSIDTYKAEVAAKAIDAGVGMVNDVTAGRSDKQMFSTLAKYPEVPVVLMYSKDATPRTTVEAKYYDNVVDTVKSFLRERKDEAVHQGISADRIILDPGLGHFVSSNPEFSFQIIARLSEFLELGSPLFISPSRKSFLEGKEKLPTAERLSGTIAASSLAVQNGASYIRTHDVLEVRRACEIAFAICSTVQRM